MIQIADVFALATSQEEQYAADITDHPAEVGSNFADNQVNKPVDLTRDCIISATPLGANRNAAFGPNIVAGCKARLIALRDTREPVTVIEPDATYENMMIESVVFTRSIKTGDALAFKIKFKQFDVQTNERVVIEVAIPRAQGTNTKGSKSSKKPDPASTAAEDKRSRLRRVANYFGVASHKTNPGGGL